MLKCILTTPNDLFLRSSFFDSDVNRSGHKSGHVRSQTAVQNQTRICAQSKLRSSRCLAKNRVERVYSCFVLKLNVCLLQSQHQSSMMNDVFVRYMSLFRQLLNGGSRFLIKRVCTFTIEDLIVLFTHASFHIEL